MRGLGNLLRFSAIRNPPFLVTFPPHCPEHARLDGDRAKPTCQVMLRSRTRSCATVDSRDAAVLVPVALQRHSRRSYRAGTAATRNCYQLGFEICGHALPDGLAHKEVAVPITRQYLPYAIHCRKQGRFNSVAGNHCRQRSIFSRPLASEAREQQRMILDLRSLLDRT